MSASAPADPSVRRPSTARRSRRRRPTASFRKPSEVLSISQELGALGVVEYYGYRYYHTNLGRWLSRDPIGERGGLNLFAYLTNGPMDAFDFLGKDKYRDPQFGNLMDCRTGLPYTGITGANNHFVPSYLLDGLSYMEGAGHYFGSSGTDIHVPFSTVDPGWTARDIFTIDRLNKYKLSKTHDVDFTKGYDLYNAWDWKGFRTNAGPGRILIRIEGELTIDRDFSLLRNTATTKWRFRGTISAITNTFDFNPRPLGERDPGTGFAIKECITRIINYQPFGKNYDVIFDGKRKVTGAGCIVEKGI